jgi:hypothetical protein
MKTTHGRISGKVEKVEKVEKVDIAQPRLTRRP